MRYHRLKYCCISAQLSSIASIRDDRRVLQDFLSTCTALSKVGGVGISKSTVAGNHFFQALRISLDTSVSGHARSDVIAINRGIFLK